MSNKLIFEIGINHLGKNKIANSMIKDLIKTNCYGFSFQVLDDKFYKKHKKYSEYRLDIDFFLNNKILKNNKTKCLGFASDSFEYLKKLNDKLDFKFIKVLSKDFDNHDLIINILKFFDKEIYISTGLQNFDQIRIFKNRYKKYLNKINFIHTQLNNNINFVNLKFISFMKKNLHKKISYGHHASNINAVFTSIAFEPDTIFIYIKPNITKYIPDNYHALNIKDLNIFTKNFTDSVTSLGGNLKLKQLDWIES